MREIIEKVYTYEELNDNAKEIVKQWILKEFRYEDVFEEMILEELKILFPQSDLKVSFSLNSCQGDGLNIHGELNINDFLNHSKNFSNDEIKDFVNDCEKLIELPVNKFRYAYCYIDTLDLSIFYNGNNKILCNKIEHEIKSIFKELCCEYEKEGYLYFYEIEEQEIKDICETNGCEFLENGEIYQN